MEAAERLRVVGAFGFLGLAAVAVAVRLVDLQLFASADVGARALRAQTRAEALPAPRGTLTDRVGRPLAVDRPVWEIRAEVTLLAPPLAPGAKAPRHVDEFAAARDRFAADVAASFAVPERGVVDLERVDELRERIVERVQRRLQAAADAGGRLVEPRAMVGSRGVRIDVLVERGVEDDRIVERLWHLDHRRSRSAARSDRSDLQRRAPYAVAIHTLRRHVRQYAEPEALFGLVGTLSVGAGVRGDDRVPVVGLERLRALEPRESGQRLYRVHARGAAYWARPDRPAGDPIEVRTTLDLELCRRADAELQRAVRNVAERRASPPEWGALMLVDVADGSVLAVASHATRPDGEREPTGAFGPSQRVFEPGSIVKPLHIALGLEAGAFRIDDIVDTGDGALRFGRGRRSIVDDHPAPSLSVHDVLVKSSNVGAVRLGMRLGIDGLEDYLRRYRFGRAALPVLPGEIVPDRPPDLRRLPEYEQRLWTAPSVCFGYALPVTVGQVARAFLSLVSGRARELRLIDALIVDGRVEPVPAPADGERFLSPGTIAQITEALVDVVHVGTARGALRELDGALLLPGDVAGKTGTSRYDGAAVRWDGTSEARARISTATFVGYSPAHAPRYLAVAVIQKVGVSGFYGGTYAAPAAIRLLLHARAQEQRSAASVGRSGPAVAEGGSSALRGPELGGSGR